MYIKSEDDLEVEKEHVEDETEHVETELVEQEPDSSIPRLGYWKMRGVAQPIRFLLAYLEVPYVEKVYE